MWLLYVLGRTFRGAWRLFVGLILGLMLYVYMFLSHKEMWQQIHDGGADLMRSLFTMPALSDYLQWNTILHLDEKLIFALYILVGRMIWLLIEEALFVFPYWLFRGRHEQRELEAARELVRQQKEAELRAAEAGLAALKSQLTAGSEGERHSLVAALDRMDKAPKPDGLH